MCKRKKFYKIRVESKIFPYEVKRRRIMKKKRERRIAMLLAIMMLIMNLIVSPVWAGQGVAIDETNFPDKNFRTFVSTIFDKDNDGKLSDWEIAGVTSIDVDYGNIADLTGIEYFTALEYLDCSGNQLTSLDVSSNTALQVLYCDANKLTNLDVSNKPALQELDCGNNQLTSLDISKNTALQKLNCDANKLTNLDVSNSPALQEIDCSENQLTSLDLSNNPSLKGLWCYNNQLTSLDVSNSPALQEIDCSKNQLTSLDVSNNPKLQKLYCWENQLTNLDVSKNPALQELECGLNQLTKLDVSNSPALKKLGCGNNQLSTLDISKNTALEYLDCQNNKLTKLDVSKNTELKELYCSDNQLTNLGLSNNPALEHLHCSRNQLTKLDVSNKSALKELLCEGNQLTSLDLSNNTQILNFDGDNQTYDVKVKTSDMKIPYADFPGTFDITKATNIAGADSNFIVDATKPSKVTYNYDTGLTGKNINVTLNITYDGYTVTFNTNGGTAISAQTITAGEHVTKPTDPTKDGYTFAGWYKDAEFTTAFDFATETINADTTIYAKWTQNAPPTPVTYTLTASVDGGHGSVTPTSKTVNKDETVTLTFAPDTGYEIEEVKVNNVATPVSGNTLTLTMDGDKTVVVKYKSTPPTPPTPEQYKVTFDANGGTGTMADVTKNKGESFTLPACGFTPPAGKEFKAWQVDGTEKNVGDNITVSGNITIKAVWKDIGSLPPTPPVPPTPYIPGPYPYPWTRYPGYWYNIETPKPKEEKPVTKMEIDWKLELSIGIDVLNREINGVQSKIKMDIAPYIKEGRTMLPVRYVAEALGFDVDWNESTRTVILKEGSTRVEIPVDTNKIIVNGTVYTSDVKPEIKNNRTMLPIANIARALGLKDGKDIIWNSKSKMVTIYRTIVVK